MYFRQCNEYLLNTYKFLPWKLVRYISFLFATLSMYLDSLQLLIVAVCFCWFSKLRQIWFVDDWSSNHIWEFEYQTGRRWKDTGKCWESKQKHNQTNLVFLGLVKWVKVNFEWFCAFLYLYFHICKSTHWQSFVRITYSRKFVPRSNKN